MLKSSALRVGVKTLHNRIQLLCFSLLGMPEAVAPSCTPELSGIIEIEHVLQVEPFNRKRR